MSLHVVVKLPDDGPLVYADYREPVVPAMQRYLKATAVEHEPPRPEDVRAITSWYAANWQRSDGCRRAQGLNPEVLTCGHD